MELSLSLFRPVRLFMQAEAAECGLACLAMVANHLGVAVDLDGLRRRFPVSARGMTLKSVVQVSDGLGLAARPLRLEPQSLSQLRRPAILHWDLNHFVVLVRVGGKGIWVNDPGRGVRHYTHADVGRHFTGVALELTKISKVDLGAPTRRVHLSDLWQGVRGLTGALLSAFALAFAVQVISLLMPLASQLMIDHAIPKGDLDLLLLITLGLGFAHVISGAATAARGYLVNFVASNFSFQILGNVFRHLLSLPMTYFAQRRLGDIHARYGAAKAVQQFVTQTSVGVAIDILTAGSAAVAMMLYSPMLTGLSIIGLLLTGGMLIAGYRHTFAESYQQMETQVRETSIFMETVRAMQPIKLFGYEAMRFAAWQNALADVVASQYRLTRLRSIYGGTAMIASTAIDLTVLYMSARAVIEGTFSIGMMTAFASWRAMFSSRAGALTQAALGLQGLRLNLDRLSDLVRTEPEQTESTSAEGGEIGQGVLQLDDVSFRYSAADPLILDSIRLEVAPGELLAITGPSGCGKTTLIRIMLGLIRPTEGEVRIDGQPLGQFGIGAYRRQVGAVMQDDQLLSGSIADNITFFDQISDEERMIWAARMACIDDDIRKMPMGYHSLVGELGSNLSGGQKQRVLLARALYRRPKLLIMDEGTSALDVAIEREVGANVRSLGITRIIVAHRPETIRTADRVISLDKGRVAGDLRRDLQIAERV